mmetsp:Transcript_17746/g.23135  ORF Transcript_17746/g.23135 Transcript_17746/m.23135 type:complete len:182 (+) Transcript_17746:78-623(+)
MMLWTVVALALTTGCHALVTPLAVQPRLKRSPVLQMTSTLTKETPVTINSEGPTGGMFTASSPEDRRVGPPDGGEIEFKVVYVVLESQYQSSMSAAVREINEKTGIKTECVGYLLEELRDPANVAAFKRDLADANVFVGSLIFVQELADVVAEAVKAERERLDAVVVFPSMPEVMRLNKLG